MDNGKLTDHHGKTVDFRNTILIMTTNAGAADMARESIGFGAMSREDAQEDAVKKMFTPEFRNRLDAIVPFAYLPPAVVARVVDKFILQLELQLADRNVHIELDDEAREWLTTAATTSSTARGRWAGWCRRRSSSRWPRNCCSASWSTAARSRSASRTMPRRSRSHLPRRRRRLSQARLRPDLLGAGRRRRADPADLRRRSMTGRPSWTPTAARSCSAPISSKDWEREPTTAKSIGLIDGGAPVALTSRKGPTSPAFRPTAGRSPMSASTTTRSAIEQARST
jgi:hypothetical protein